MRYVVDPVHGRIVLPQWLDQIRNLPEIRRIVNIRQLGLKAYVSFPGAIHTRYSHCLGTMHLSDILRRHLFAIEQSNQRVALMENLQHNEEALKAAGFFHDIGHGPFSHVLDFPMKRVLRKDHTELAVEVVRKYKDLLEGESISVDQVCKIISKSVRGNAKTPYEFVRQIIDGPLDVDKMDYLLRDSFHVGYKYRFDLDHLMDQIRVLGEGNDLSGYQIGLADTPEAIVVAEHFLLLWRSMYSLVYYEEKTRIAEKMLEKAVLVAAQQNKRFKRSLSKPDLYLKLDEARLIDLLIGIDGFPEETMLAILEGRYYETVASIRFHQNLQASPDFLDAVENDPEVVADKISIILGESEDEYSVICDIVTNRTPENIRIDSYGPEGEPVELASKSEVVKAMSVQERNIYVYARHDIADKSGFKKDRVQERIVQIMGDWKG